MFNFFSRQHESEVSTEDSLATLNERVEMLTYSMVRL